ncbi:histone-fold-containing protein [Amylocystis lapponica]|nr:histone-fold-containing protein [Amylocystis lapponica]
MAEESDTGAASGRSSPINVNFGDDIDDIPVPETEVDPPAPHPEGDKEKEVAARLGSGEGRKEAKAKKEREPGKSLLPFSRVQKILKADDEMPMVAREATLSISLATEEFVARFIEAAHRAAQRDKRTTVQHRDVASVVRRMEEYAFLEDIIPWSLPAEPRKPKALQNKDKDKPTEKTMLDRFFKGGDRDTSAEEEAETNVVMNEDGTMSVGPQ